MDKVFKGKGKNQKPSGKEIESAKDRRDVKGWNYMKGKCKEEREREENAEGYVGNGMQGQKKEVGKEG